MPGLREALGLAEDGTASPGRGGPGRGQARALVEAMELAGWRADAAPAVAADVLGARHEPVERLLRFAAAELVPRLEATTGELDAVLHALDGGHVPAGPSGSPLRGLVNVLPTGRNFYAVDPKAVPSRLAWETGQQLADSLLARYREETGGWPRVGRPVGVGHGGHADLGRRRRRGPGPARGATGLGRRLSRRVTGLEVVDLAELGRPRIDVVDPDQRLLPRRLPARGGHAGRRRAAWSPASTRTRPATCVRAHALADLERHDDLRRATTRIFGSPPGAYGAGLLPLMDSRSLARRRRPGRGLRRLGRPRLRARAGGAGGPRGHGARLPADRRRGQEHRHPRARHRRLRRLLPVPRGHGGHRPPPHRRRPPGVRRRQHPARAGQDPFAARGVGAGLPLAGGQPPLGAGDAAPRLQGRLRAGGDGRLPVRLGRHHRGGGRLDVRAADRRLRPGPETREFLEQSNPWALRGITERLLEAVDRGLWEAPEDATLQALRQVYLQVEGQLEETHS